jgi:hypothetical protein
MEPKSSLPYPQVPTTIFSKLATENIQKVMMMMMMMMFLL